MVVSNGRQEAYKSKGVACTATELDLQEHHIIEPANPRQNQLLASLPDAEWKRWLPQLELVDLPLGTVLHESGAPTQFVYFPTNAIVSLLHVLDDGSSAEVAVVGFEGVVDISIFMGGGSTSSRSVVQNSGMGYRLRADAIAAELESSGPAMRLMLRFTQALITQMSQTAVCNFHHSLDQRLCRWLLLRLDRLPDNELVTTQESISNMLGVRRGDVIEATLKLQTAGVIRCSRGHITVLDRPKLECRTCECHQVVKKEYDRLLPSVVAI